MEGDVGIIVFTPFDHSFYTFGYFNSLGTVAFVTDKPHKGVKNMDSNYFFFEIFYFRKTFKRFIEG